MTPITEGLLDEDFVDQLKLAGTYNEDSFEREYCSKWTGDAENAFFSSEKIDKSRVLNQPEYEASGRSSKNAYYVLGVDVGRLDDLTEISIIKVTPQPQGASIKSLVNLFTLEKMTFENQAIEIKKLFFKYKARAIALDAMGIGAGLVDFMILSQVDPETGDELPPFGVGGGSYEDAAQPYKKIKGNNVEEDVLYLIKANAPLNSEAYSYAKNQIGNGKVKFLIDEATAKAKYTSTKVGQQADLDKRNEYLRPFVLTGILKEQLLNLVEETEGVNIILKRASKKIKKDKVSSFCYALYYIKQEEERRMKRKKRDMSKLTFFS